MDTSPNSFQYWRSRARTSPEKAALEVLERISHIAPATRSTVFASLPSREQLIENFAQASASDTAMAGVPFLLKDLFDFPGFETTASSSFLREVRPAPERESALSHALREQGAAFCGKTHLNEFAYGLSGENLHYGDCPHPIFFNRLSGGSSSGSAWAVRRGIVPIATGTDTGGSIRVPAAWCGLYGIRFSPNAWSTEGCFPLAPSFDTAGWLTRNASDMATSIRALVEPSEFGQGKLRGLNLLDAIKCIPGKMRSLYSDTIEKLDTHRSKDASEAYQSATAEVVSSYAILQSIDAFQVHGPWIDSHRERYDPVVWQRLDRARNWSGQQVEAAKVCEEQVIGFFDTCFQEFDYILLPATQSPAISPGEHTDAYRNDLLSITAPGSFARCPALTIPIHLETGESLGLQVLYKNENSAIPLKILEELQS